MKKTIALIAFIGISNVATAADSPRLQHRFTDYAQVLDVEPVYKRVEYKKPQRECWIEQEEQIVTYEGSNQNFGRSTSGTQSSHRGGDAIIGGIIGGVIGNQIGRHGGRGARNGATIAGAIVGSVLANEASSSVSRSTSSGDSYRHRRQRRVEQPVIQNTRPSRTVTTRPVERCRETVQTSYEQRIRAYDVTYRYRGQTFTTRMKRDPGDRIELQINVAPARQ